MERLRLLYGLVWSIRTQDSECLSVGCKQWWFITGKIERCEGDYWTPFNPSNDFPRPTHNSNVTYQSALAIQDASYIRLQNISIGYTFPKKWINKAHLNNVRIYANIQNVYTWSKYKGMDPEVGAMYGDALMTGVDYGRYPSPRIYTFGLNVSF